MSFKTIQLIVVFDEEADNSPAIAYALELCEREKAHLTAFLAAPVLSLPSGRIVPLVHAVIDQVNDDRLKKAQSAQSEIETQARLAGIVAECHVVHKPYPAVRARLIDRARLSDLTITQQPTGILSTEQGIIEGVLFGSGRPTIVVPRDWRGRATFDKIVVAWDGSARAARAVGDAMPLLCSAQEVEVVCIVDEAKTSVTGADLSDHLARHGCKVTLTDLQLEYADAGRVLRDHVSNVVPDLLVMGAFAHSRLFQFFLGGVTSTMLTDAKVPVFYSY
jgi:nucleotide-binding universal stress UspA family protein